MPQVTIDLVTKRPDGAFTMVLVEQGPWAEEPADHLRALQNRLYDCVDVVLDGQLANRYPDSKGRPLVISVEAYNTPPSIVATFVSEFATAIRNSTPYQGEIASSVYVSSLEFECREGSPE